MVIVLFHSDRGLLDACLASVADAAAYAEADVRVVFVDNGGGVPALGADRLPSVIVGSGRNLGFGRAVNAAFAAVTAPFVLLLNPDAALDPAAVEGFLRADRTRPGAILGGTMLTEGRIDPDSFLDWDFSVERFVKRRRAAPSAGPDGLVDVAKVTGGALFARADVLRSFGPFDERFFLYAEDADLSRRAARAGVPLAQVPGAVVHHVGSASARSFAALVEFTRADAAVRLTAVHRSRAVSLAQRLELLLATVTGMALERDGRRRRARAARLCALRRWSFRRDRPALLPEDLDAIA